MAFMPKYKWIALENLTTIEMKKLIGKSKIYVDFGNHPGKDRIPREAAINAGSANNSIDLSINDEYKFEDPIKEKKL
jgi:hypothetical protein